MPGAPQAGCIVAAECLQVRGAGVLEPVSVPHESQKLARFSLEPASRTANTRRSPN